MVGKKQKKKIEAKSAKQNTKRKKNLTSTGDDAKQWRF